MVIVSCGIINDSMELALLHGPQGATWNKGAPPPQIRDNPLFEVVEPLISGGSLWAVVER